MRPTSAQPSLSEAVGASPPGSARHLFRYNASEEGEDEVSTQSEWRVFQVTHAQSLGERRTRRALQCSPEDNLQTIALFRLGSVRLALALCCAVSRPIKLLCPLPTL
mmetsp:Transcript_10322/g.21064  ORF Transcript_10322/g.21064 Transcript_10322/m.21064 type:complete len:107 (+) Transcript_10322:115-435(+)